MTLSSRPLQKGAAILGVVSCVVGGIATAQASGLTAAIRAEDARLEKRVTLFLPRCTLQEAVQALQEQTGVALSAPSPKSLNKEYGEDRLCVVLRDAPLGDALDALYSLMSYRGASWDWRRTGEITTRPEVAYVLRRSPGGLARLGEPIAAQVQTDYEAQASSLEKTLKLPVERQKELGASNFDIGAMFYKDPVIASRQRGGLETFFSALSPEQRLNVLRGASIEVTVKDLPEVGKKFARETWDYAQSANHAPAPMLPYVKFRTDTVGSLCPILRITPGGYSYIGNLFEEARQRKKVAALWKLRDDVPPASADTLTVNKPDKPAPYPLPELASKEALNDPNELAQFFWRVSEGASVSLMAVLPPKTSNTTLYMTPPLTQQSPYGKTLSSLLAALGEYPYWVDSKWRGNVLLLRDAAAPFVGVRPPQAKNEAVPIPQR